MAYRVTALVPARNEEQNIEACVRSLLAQGEDVEVRVADDGSTDRTAAIVRAIAAGTSRLRLLSVPALPAGWIGKNHALACAARATSSEWLLFTDADTVHAEGGLHAVRERAERDNIALFSLSPRQETRAWYEKAVIPRVYRALERRFRFEDINDPLNPAAAANGQYILVRRSVYEAAGGHAALRAEILEDVKLAERVKQAGARLRFEPGAGIVRTRMYRDFSGLWQGWTKNLYLLFNKAGWRMIASAASIAVADIAPVAVAAWYPAPALAWLAARHIWYAWRLKRAGASPALAIYYWPGSVLFAALLLNSLFKYVAGRSVAWKGRSYIPSGDQRVAAPRTAPVTSK